MPRVWAGASAFSARFRQKGLARKGAVMAAMGKAEVLQYLDDQEVFYQKVEHEPVFTMEGMEQLNLPFAAEVVKNLFLRDDKKRAYYLVVMPEDKPANLKALRAMLESRPLRFASADDLEAILGLRAGAVRRWACSTTTSVVCRWCSTRSCAATRGWASIPMTTRQRCMCRFPTCWPCSTRMARRIASCLWSDPRRSPLRLRWRFARTRCVRRGALFQLVFS